MKKDVFNVWPKFVIGFVLCFAIRLLPFRPPNIEPVFATTMPFARRLGAWSGALFGFLSIVLFDMATGKVGMWTWITAVAYAAVGAGAYAFLRNKKSSAMAYVSYAVIGTVLYDAATGLSVGPLFYDQPFMEALTGQIPYTINHLIGNVILAIVLSPLVDRWIVSSASLDWNALKQLVHGRA